MKWVCKKTGVDKTSEVIKRLEQILIKDGYTIVKSKSRK